MIKRKMNNINNVKELRLEIQRLKDLKKVKEEIILMDWKLVNSYLSPVVSVFSFLKGLLFRKIGSNIWLEIISFVLKEMKDKEIFSSGFNSIIGLIRSLFKRKS